MHFPDHAGMRIELEQQLASRIEAGAAVILLIQMENRRQIAVAGQSGIDGSGESPVVGAVEGDQHLPAVEVDPVDQCACSGGIAVNGHRRAAAEQRIAVPQRDDPLQLAIKR